MLSAKKTHQTKKPLSNPAAAYMFNNQNRYLTLYFAAGSTSATTSVQKKREEPLCKAQSGKPYYGPFKMKLGTKHVYSLQLSVQFKT